MQIAFEVAGAPAEFRRDAVTGKTLLKVGNEIAEPENPHSLATGFSFRLRRTWRYRVGDHGVEIEKVRPLLFAGFRPNSFTVRVDGTIVAQAQGV